MSSVKLTTTGGNGGTVELKGPANTTSNAAVQLTLPVNDGDADQYLKTDGSGTLSWATVAGGVDGISSSADATAITIDSSERVGIGTTDPGTRRVKIEHTTDTPLQLHSTQSNCYMQLGNSSATNGYLGFETTNLTFHNNGKKAEIDTSGNLKVNAGNLVIGTAGKGIDFSATGDAAGKTSELLDDFEEGTFTPAWNQGSASTAMMSATAYESYTNGKYIKIGDFVAFTIVIECSSHTARSNTDVILSGLPFTSENTDAKGGAYFSIMEGVSNNIENANVTIRQQNNATYLQFWKTNGAAYKADTTGASWNDKLEIAGHYWAA